MTLTFEFILDDLTNRYDDKITFNKTKDIVCEELSILCANIDDRLKKELKLRGVYLSFKPLTESLS